MGFRTLKGSIVDRARATVEKLAKKGDTKAATVGRLRRGKIGQGTCPRIWRDAIDMVADNARNDREPSTGVVGFIVHRDPSNANVVARATQRITGYANATWSNVNPDVKASYRRITGDSPEDLESKHYTWTKDGGYVTLDQDFSALLAEKSEHEGSAIEIMLLSVVDKDAVSEPESGEEVDE